VVSIPIASTTGSVLRVPTDYTRDSYDALPDWETIATGVRAHISSPGGTEIVLGGTQSDVLFSLACDPCDLRHTDRWLDEPSGVVYDVVWSAQRVGLGLDHCSAGLRLVLGEP
jgi:hypothetical protein